MYVVKKLFGVIVFEVSTDLSTKGVDGNDQLRNISFLDPLLFLDGFDSRNCRVFGRSRNLLMQESWRRDITTV